MRNQWLVADAGSATPSDKTLVENVRRGERQCFAIIMRRYNQRLFRVARSIVGNDNDAEDVVQQAYVCAYVNLEQFAGAAALSTWLTRIVINEALARIKSRGRLQNFVDDDRSADLVADEAGFPSPEDDLSRRQLTKLLEAAIDELPELCRVALILREVEGLSTAETAACLAISEQAVRVRLHRARALLRDGLAERVGAAGPDLWSFAGERCRRITARVLAAFEAPPGASKTAGVRR